MSKIAQLFHTVRCPLKGNYCSPSKSGSEYTAEIYAVLAKTVLVFGLSLLLQKSEVGCQSKEVVLLSEHCKYS